MSTFYYKFVIKAYASATTGTAINTINFYDSNNTLMTVTSADVVSHNYDSRNTTANINQLFINGIASPYAPYMSTKVDAQIIVKLVDKPLSKITLVNYDTTAYYTNNVLVYKSIDNANYTLCESVTFSAVNESKNATQNLNPLAKHLFYSTNGRLKTFNFPDNTKSSVPVMTSATAPSGKVTSSSIQGSNYDWMAFDGIPTSNGWLGNGTTNQWLQYEFPIAKVITRYSIICNYSSTAQTPKDWVFQGSNDNGNTWYTLDTQSQTASTWTLGVKRTFSFKNATLFKVYRIFCYTNNGGSYMNITEMEMFEDFGEVITVSTAMPTESDFINFGMDTIAINPVKINRKKYITSNKTVLGSGNTFDKTLDIAGSKINSLFIY